MRLEPASIIATIDFEASSLSGYPIEVGVAVWHRKSGEIRVWSTLIRPLSYWRRNAARWWDPRSEQIHGISPDQLDAGLHPKEVMRHLETLIDGLEVYCDGGPYDQAFLARLSDAGGARPTFRLGDLRALMLCADLDDLGRVRFGALLAEGAANVEHRAGPDALRLLRAAAAAAGESPSVVVGRG